MQKTLLGLTQKTSLKRTVSKKTSRKAGTVAKNQPTFVECHDCLEKKTSYCCKKNAPLKIEGFSLRLVGFEILFSLPCGSLGLQGLLVCRLNRIALPMDLSITRSWENGPAANLFLCTGLGQKSK